MSAIFLTFPFMMVWTVSLRFIQKYIQTTKMNKFLNTLLIFYLFPPIGCIMISVYEIGWIFYDMYLGLSSFVRGSILIIEKDSQITSVKQFRKIIEVFGESIPQTLIQLYMFYARIKVDSFDLALSLAVSLFNLGYHFYHLRKEAKFHGMSFASYAISVLQLGEIPILKLVPRLPGIRKGIISFVNFADFNIDKESLGPIVEVCTFIVITHF